MLKRPDGVKVNSAAAAEEDMNGSLFIALKDEVTKNDKVLIRLGRHKVLPFVVVILVYYVTWVS
jgi:hypothetical protein